MHFCNLKGKKNNLTKKKEKTIQFETISKEFTKVINNLNATYSVLKARLIPKLKIVDNFIFIY